MPGCDKLNTGHERFDEAVSAGIGLFAQYTGSVTLQVFNAERYTMVVDIKARGFVKGQGVVELAPEGENTQISFEGDVQIGGPIAAVGQRMHASAARLMTRQLFGAIDAEARASEG